MKNKIVIKIFKMTFGVFLIAFLVLYFTGGMGYFEYESHKKAVLTAKQIEEFEKDIASGKEVDIKDYLPKDTSNYQNKVSSMGLKVSNFTQKCVSKTIEEGFKALSKIVG